MTSTLPIPAPHFLPVPAPTPLLTDSYGRAITDLRVSLTDRCNYRCVYCRTGNEPALAPELSIADHLRMIRLFVSLGVEKVRLTGGEPLLREGLLDLLRALAPLRTPAGAPLDLALTTNGHLLAPMARDLRAAGLNRITVSMDAVDPETFTAITRVPRSFDRVLDGVRAANAAGFAPVKVNCVLLRGFNDGEIEAFARFSRDENVIVRFIEWMPLEQTSTLPGARSWSPEAVISLREITGRLARWQPNPVAGNPAPVPGLVPLPANAQSETARRYTFADGLGEIGIIAPVSEPFCGHCSRIRLTSDGKIRTCLFSQTDHDLYGRLHRGATDRQLTDYIRAVVDRKEARHHIGEPGFEKPSRSMVQIGG